MKTLGIKALSTDYGKLTGYYEPEDQCFKTRTSNYSIPILKYNEKFQRDEKKLD